MNIKKNIRRWLVASLWVVLSTGVMVLLVAAMDIKSNKACKDVDIVISGVEEVYFLDKKDVYGIIAEAGVTNLKGKPIAAFDLLRLEALLEKNVWVKDAQLFFDNNLVLHVYITEREPVARMFTAAGNSFYIDSSGYRMPLSKKLIVRLPVFTGFPSDKAVLSTGDSLLMQSVKKISRYILQDSFWMAQITQIDISPERKFTLVPIVGNTVIQFGDGLNYESKFSRLFIFYRQVLSKAGFDKYSRIDVQYDRQVVAIRKGAMPKIDSLKALTNIQRMIGEMMKITEDSGFAPAESYDAGWYKADSISHRKDSTAGMPAAKPSKPKAVKELIIKAPPVKARIVKAIAVKLPAVHPVKGAPVKKGLPKPLQPAPRVQQRPKAVMGR